VLVPGGIACINIGDATRTIGGVFVLYPNHVRVQTCLVDLGLSPLPTILWRKQTNAPTKFMGSGMFPPGAYVTLEHEYVLIVRKGDKRAFHSDADRRRRRESAYFWEERNTWFSDVWFDLKGTGQGLLGRGTRERSGAFPFELAYRLISMFSVRGDTVLDPFIGTGTTMLAAMAAARNSVGFERDDGLKSEIVARTDRVVEESNARINERLASHVGFVRERFGARGRFGYRNGHHGFPVVTKQESELVLNRLMGLRVSQGCAFEVDYEGTPQVEQDWSWFFGSTEEETQPKRRTVVLNPSPRQLELFPTVDEE
jgi:DNA modification methylase